MRRFAAFLRQEEGATAVEYAVLLALILVVMMATITQFGAASGGMWGNIDSELNSHGF
jgi:pilus assembly protein Flp/PilA